MTLFCAYLSNLLFKLSLMFLRFIYVHTFHIQFCDNTMNYLFFYWWSFRLFPIFFITNSGTVNILSLFFLDVGTRVSLACILWNVPSRLQDIHILNEILRNCFPKWWYRFACPLQACKRLYFPRSLSALGVLGLVNYCHSWEGEIVL